MGGGRGETAPSSASILSGRACSLRLHTGSSATALTVAHGSVWTAATAPADGAPRRHAARVLARVWAARPGLNWLNEVRLVLRGRPGC